MASDKFDPTDDSNFFWQSKYKKIETTGVESYIDGSDTLANKGHQVLSFHHVPSGKQVFFKAFITKYSENYTSDWGGGEQVFGRTDPIYTFSHTTRKIELGFSVPAGSESEAFENMGRVQRLIQFLYPAYFQSNPGSKVDGSNTIGQSPLVRIKMMNLIQSVKGDASAGMGDEAWKKRKELYEEYKSSWLPTNGLLAAIQNVSVNTELSKEGVLEKAPNTVMPKNFEITLSFAVIHEHTLGWDESGNSLDPTFPYGVVLAEPGKLKVDEGHHAGTDNPDAELGAAFWKGGIENGRIDQERMLQAAQDSEAARYGGVWNWMTGKAKRHSGEQGGTYGKDAVFIWGAGDDRAANLYNEVTTDQAKAFREEKKKK